MRGIHKISIGWLAAALIATAGCATAPTRQLTESKSGVRAATEMGAPETPKAAYHLQLAKEQIAHAQPLMDGGRQDKRMARHYLERAQLDAELAIVYARTSDVEEEAKRAWAEVDTLQSEMTQ